MRNIQLTCKRPACSGGRNCQSGPQSRLGNQPGHVNIYVFNKTGKQFGSIIGLPTRKCEVMQFLFLRMGKYIGTQEKICQDGLAILHYSMTTIHHLEEGSLQVLFIVSDPEVGLFFLHNYFCFFEWYRAFSTFPFFLDVCSGVPKIYDLTSDCFKSQLSKPSLS